MTTAAQPLAFSYLRFSTPDQQRGDSFRRQTELAEKYAREHGLRLDFRSFADLGVSAFRGANLSTGKLGEFLEAVRLGHIPTGSYLLMESLDRMSRADPWDAVHELRKIVRAGIRVVTLTNGRVFGAGGEGAGDWELLEAVIALTLAHQESALKARRLKAAWHKKRADAAKKPMTAIAPAWLRLREDRLSFEVVSDRAETVRGIFAAYLSGEGTHSIAEGLNRRKVPPFGRAKFWHRSYIVKMLESRAVIGEFTPHTTSHEDGKKRRVPQSAIKGYYPAVVDPETFSRVQAMREAKRGPAQSAGSRKVSHLLAGVARCHRCGSAMVRVTKGIGAKGGRPFLVCSRAKAGAGCEYRGVRVEEVEAGLIRGIGDVLRRVPKGSATLEDAERRYFEELRTAEARIAALLGFIGDGMASAAIGDELARLEARKAELLAGLRKVQALQAGRNAIALPARIEVLRRAIDDGLDEAAINAAIRQLFGKVVVHGDGGKLDFHWHHGGVTQLSVPLTDRRDGARRRHSEHSMG